MKTHQSNSFTSLSLPEKSFLKNQKFMFKLYMTQLS